MSSPFLFSTKTCFKCRVEKALTEFYAHKKMRGGKLNKCKDCTKRDTRKNRRERETSREYDVLRYKTCAGRRAYSEKNSASWKKRHPEKANAHQAVSRAIARGQLIRQNCEFCSRIGHAHHEDYSKPLAVRWLCPLHHHRLHHGETHVN